MSNLLAMHRATDTAFRAHSGQRRKGLDEPYVLHPLRVALLASQVGLPEDAVVAAILHDVVEDTSVTLADLRELGDFSERTLALVSLLTKTYGDDALMEVKRVEKPLYYERILTDADARHLKLLDRIDNLRDMIRMLAVDPKAKRAWAAKYLTKTLDEFEPLLALPVLPLVRIWYDHALAGLADALGN